MTAFLLLHAPCNALGCNTQPRAQIANGVAAQQSLTMMTSISCAIDRYTTTAHPARRQAVLLVAQMCSIFGARPQWLQGRARAGERAPGVLGEETLMTR